MRKLKIFVLSLFTAFLALKAVSVIVIIAIIPAAGVISGILTGVAANFAFQAINSGVAWAQDKLDEKEQLELELSALKNKEEAKLGWDWKTVGADIIPYRADLDFEVWNEGFPAYKWKVRDGREDTVEGYVIEPGYQSGKSINFSGFITNYVGYTEAKYDTFIKHDQDIKRWELLVDLHAEGPDKWWVINQRNAYDENFINKFATQPSRVVFEDRHGAEIKYHLDTDAFNRPYTDLSMYYYQFDSSVVYTNLLNVNGTLHSTDLGYKMPLSTEPDDIHRGFRYAYSARYSLLSNNDSGGLRPLMFESQDEDANHFEYYDVLVALNVELLQPSIPYYNRNYYETLMRRGVDAEEAKQAATIYYWDSADNVNKSKKAWEDERYVMSGQVVIREHSTSIENAILAGDYYPTAPTDGESDVYPIVFWRRNGIPSDGKTIENDFFTLPKNSRVRNKRHYCVVGGGVKYHTGDKKYKTIFIDPKNVSAEQITKTTDQNGAPMIELY